MCTFFGSKGFFFAANVSLPIEKYLSEEQLITCKQKYF
jgi:hypothetical protein